MNEQPTNEELMNAILGVREGILGVKGEVTRLDSKIGALNRKLDVRVDEVLVTINEYATVTDRRLVRLESLRA